MWKFALLLASFVTTSDADAATRSYFAPQQDGLRLSSCLSNGTACGKPAADAFCQKQGFAESILFARELVQSTLFLDADQRCETGQCEAFARIKCYQPQTQAVVAP